MSELKDQIGLVTVGEHSNNAIADLVFIHGLGGGSHTTWAADGKAENFWPEWVAQDIPQFAVWTLGYHTQISDWLGQSMPMSDLGISQLEELHVSEIGKRPVIFIVHSMGGILVKQMISHAVTQGVERYEAFPKMIRGVIFIATPHRGADLPGLAEFLGCIFNASDQIKELNNSSSRLQDLHGVFRNFVNKQEIVCRTFAERREVRAKTKVLFWNVTIPKGMLVVDPASAEPDIPGERAIPLDEDHFSICKPLGKSEKIYRYTINVLQESARQMEPEFSEDAPEGTPHKCIKTLDNMSASKGSSNMQKDIENSQVATNGVKQSTINSGAPDESEQSEFKWDVFLSYSHANKIIVSKIAQRLGQDGFRVWFDEISIELGQSIPQGISAGLAHSQLMVFFMSDQSCNSEWAKFESQSKLFRDPNNRELTFVPVRLDQVEPPKLLEQFKYLDWKGNFDEEYSKLKAWINRQLTKNITDPGEIKSSAEQSEDTFSEYSNWLQNSVQEFLKLYHNLNATLQSAVRHCIGFQHSESLDQLQDHLYEFFDGHAPKDSTDNNWFDDAMADLERIELEHNSTGEEKNLLHAIQDLFFQMGFPKRNLSELAKCVQVGGSVITCGVATQVLAELSTAFANDDKPDFQKSGEPELGVQGTGMLRFAKPPLGDGTMESLVEDVLADLAKQLSVDLVQPEDGKDTALYWASQLERGMAYLNRQSGYGRSKDRSACRYYCIINPPQDPTLRQQLLELLEQVNAKIPALAIFILERRAENKATEEIILQLLKRRFSA